MRRKIVRHSLSFGLMSNDMKISNVNWPRDIHFLFELWH